MGHSEEFLTAATRVCQNLPTQAIEALANELASLRDRHGRLFFLGVGGSAANCGHAVNDFRKICGIEAYSPTDNVAELTAYTNDIGWENVFTAWLKISDLNEKDAIFVMSVGGGASDVSQNLVRAIHLAKMRWAKVYGIVGRDSGYTAKNADICIRIPYAKEEWVTPLSEAFQAVVWHCLVSHPALRVA